MSQANKLLVLACGCGRLGFDGVGAARDGAPDGVPDDVAVMADAFTVCHTGTWSAPQPISETVTTSEEADPSLTADERTMVFSSNRSPSMGRALWMTTRPTRQDPWAAPARLVALDSAADDIDADISADGLTLYFGSTRSGTRELYLATRSTLADPFALVGLVTVTGDAVTTRGGPTTTLDGLIMFYARDLEVAFATRASTAVDFTFEREVDEVNAPPTDGNPAISADGIELFFDTYRNGPAAIFTASRGGIGSSFVGLTELSELPAMVPTSTAAGTPELSADGRTLYMFVNVGGQLDLYAATRDCP